MEDFEKNQIKNIKKLADAQDPSETSEFLTSALSELSTVKPKLTSVVLGGKNLTDTETYKTHYPIFLQIVESTYASGIWKVIGILAKAANNNTIRPVKNLSLQEVASSFAACIKEEQNKEIVSAIFLPNDEVTRLLKGLKDYEQASNQNYSNPNKTTKHKYAADLYKDSFEMYLKILKDIHAKLTGTKDAGNNSVYKYFQENYPVLMASVDNHLRNDPGHLSYDQREKYTAEELMEKGNNLIAAVSAYLVAAGDVYIGSFEMNLKVFNVVNDSK